jgi:phosphoglycolate phosphatase
VNFEALVFDLDGTLIDSVPDVAVALNKVLAAAGRSQLSLEQVRGFVGHGAWPMLDGVFALTGEALGGNDAIDDAVADYLVHYRAEPASLTETYPGVIDVLERFSGDGEIKMGICSNKPYEMVVMVLEALGLDKYFCGCTGGDNVPHQKPDGRHLSQTLAEMDAAGMRSIYVGDSQTDVDAGLDAGLPVVAVTYGYHQFDPAAAKPDVFIDNFFALPETLLRMTGLAPN